MLQLQVPGGSMSYIDEGQGPPVVLVHGTPSSSDEWRPLVNDLRSSHRVLAPDHLGFGKSDRPAQMDAYRLPWHAENFSSFINQLNLEPFHLVVHDFGGPIALPYALSNPTKVRSITLIQSWLWDLKPPKLDNALMRWLYLSWNFSPRKLVPMSWGKRSPLTREQHQSFMDHFPTRESRFGAWGFVHSLVREGAWLDEQGQRLTQLNGIPTLLIWGKADSIVKPIHLEEWKRRLPSLKVAEFDDVGHFPQLEAASEVAATVSPFLRAH